MFADLGYAIATKVPTSRPIANQNANSSIEGVNVDVNASPENVPLLSESRQDTSNENPNLQSKFQVLEHVSGCVRPGEVMAIMGGSGAGKTTLLDLLARRNKAGIISGKILVNGKEMSDTDYRSIIGYVDQEDTLMDTLTVYETVMYSALLRLPRTMSYEAKRMRVEETLMELDIVHIANRRVGKAGSRAKGKLVYSGPAQQQALDHFSNLGFNCPLGFNIADYLVDLTMHAVGTSGAPVDADDDFNAMINPIQVEDAGNESEQPRGSPFARRRSSIRVKQEELLFTPRPLNHPAAIDSQPLKGGSLSREFGDLPIVPRGGVSDDDEDEISNSRDGLSRSVPSESLLEARSDGIPIRASGSNSRFPSSASLDTSQRTPLRGNRRRRNLTNLFGTSPAGTIRGRPLSTASEHSASTDIGITFSSRQDFEAEFTDGNHLNMLVQGYSQSEILSLIKAEIAASVAAAQTPTASIGPNGNRRGRSFSSMASFRESIAESATLNRIWGNLNGTNASNRPTAWTQFKILSGRTFKNLYRNPDLLRTHYVISVVVAAICGMLFFRVKNDIGGFQNRMGLFFFICALFGFGCLSSMQVFASERLIFVRERANRYYQPITYYTSKILFDMFPLRMIPPIILGLICYHMIGLRAEDVYFLLRFLLVLILFNLTAASCCMMISIVFRDSSMASLIATLVMLFEMLFGGLLLNKGTVPKYATWLQTFSFFNCALEALVVNEVNGLTLYETKFGLQIDVPGAIILQTFGFNAKGYWQDVQYLVLMFLSFLAIGFLWLQFMHVYLPRYMQTLRSRTTVPRVFKNDAGQDRLIILPQEELDVSTKSGRPVGPEYYDMRVKLRFMEKHGIHTSVVSLANPWLDFLPGKEAETLASDLNKDLNELCNQYPEKFYGFGVLPTGSTNVESWVKEARHISTLPNLRGAILGTKGLGKGMDDAALEPFYKEVQDLGLTLFIHPHYGLSNEFYGEVENGHAISRLILSGILDRIPNLRLLLAHSGGVLPYLAGRLDSCVTHDPHVASRLQHPPSEYLKRFYYDAVAYHPPALKCAAELVGMDRLMFGTDNPFFPPLNDADAKWESVESNIRAAESAFGKEKYWDVLGGNAARILNI
ncbi:hypothetical protein HDU97_003535 [Phlyctochytrium planicorne]|nr:hypothetical protein HDU97_003535 [Phlyctochytrium planicorne]